MAKRTPHRKAGITKHKIADGIYLLRFETQYEVTSTFLRVQEHYESPQFHGRIFTLEQYMDWYVAENGAFTYFQDWSGFNDRLPAVLRGQIRSTDREREAAARTI